MSSPRRAPRQLESARPRRDTREQAPPRGCKTRVGTSTGPVPTLPLQAAPRNSNLVKAVHVDTTENLVSDFFTKSLDLATLIRFQVRKQLMTRNALSSHSRCSPLTRTLWHSTLAGRMVQPSSSCRLYSAEVLLSTGGTAMRNRALSVLRGLPTIDC